MSNLPRPLIPSLPENALNYAITQCNETILPLVRMTGHIPNIITSYSLLCGMVCVWSLQHSHFLLFVMTFILQYVSDCVNEHFARTYATTSHIGVPVTYDQVFHAVLLVVVVKRQMVGRTYFNEGPARTRTIPQWFTRSPAMVRTSHISACVHPPVPTGAVFPKAKNKSNCPATATSSPLDR